MRHARQSIHLPDVLCRSSVQFIILRSFCFSLSILATMHHLKCLLRALDAILLLRLLSRHELENNDKKLCIRIPILQDVSKRVCALLVRPRSRAHGQRPRKARGRGRG